MLNYTLKVNNVALTDYVKYDSYSTKKTPVYATPVVTLDGVSHTRCIRHKGSVSFEFNPQSATVTKTIAETLMSQPCEVYYYNLQTQTYETAIMQLDDQSADFLVLCKAYGYDWNQIGKITLTEL